MMQGKVPVDIPVLPSNVRIKPELSAMKRFMPPGSNVMPKGHARPPMGGTNVPINIPFEGLKYSTDPLAQSATYKFPSAPMASPSDDNRPPLKVSLYAPVYWLYDHTWPA